MINKGNDDFEKELFKFAENDKEVPLYVDKAIHDAVNRVKPTAKVLYKFRRVAIVLISFGLITASIVYAKEIVKFFKTIFTNSTPGIEAAIENGYVQNVDMDFIYDNSIGIKVDNVVKDDEILDVSLVFDCKNKKNIENIVLSDFSLIADDEVIFSESQREGNGLIDSIEKLNDIHLEDNLYYKSILCKFKNKIDYNKIKLKIRKIDIYKDNHFESVEGEWTIGLDILDNNKTENDNYKATYDKNILEIENTISATNFIIDIKFKDEIKMDIIRKFDSIILHDSNSNIIIIESATYDEKEKHIILEYDYGKFNLSDELTLYIKYNEEKDTLIELYK